MIRVVYSKEFQQYTPTELIDVLNEVMQKSHVQNMMMDLPPGFNTDGKDGLKMDK